MALACLGYIGWFFWSSREQLDLALSLDPLLLVAAVALHLALYVIYAYRFRLFVEKCSGRRVPFWAFLRIVVLGRFLNTMASQAGNVYRAVTLKRRHGVDYTLYLSGLMAMTWLNVVQDLLTGWALIALWGAELAGRQYAPLLLPLAAAVLTGPPVALAVLGRFELRHARLRWLHAKLTEALRPMVGGLSDPGYLLRILASGVAMFAVTLAILYIFFLAFGLEPGVPGLAVFVIVMQLSGIITVTPGNIGLREMAFGVLADQLAIGMAQGLLVSASQRVVGTAVMLLCGGMMGGFDLLREQRRAPGPD